MNNDKKSEYMLLKAYKENITKKLKEIKYLEKEINDIRNNCDHGPYLLLDKDVLHLGYNAYDINYIECLVCGEIIKDNVDPSLVIDMSDKLWYIDNDKRITSCREIAQGIFFGNYNENSSIEEIISEINESLNKNTANIKMLKKY